MKMDVSGESHAAIGRNFAAARQRSMWDWEALKKTINGAVKGVTASNVRDVAEELLSEDLIWGRGLFCSAILNSSEASPPVLAALVAAINSEFPDVGYLLLKRILNRFKTALEKKDKPRLPPLLKLLAQLLNQGVVRESIAIEILFLLLQDHPTKDSVEVAILLIQQCGSAVYGYSPRGLDSVLERFEEIIVAGDLDPKTVGLIQDLSAVRRWRLSGYTGVPPELDFVEVDDQVTHEISLLFSVLDPEMFLDLFRLNSP